MKPANEMQERNTAADEAALMHHLKNAPERLQLLHQRGWVTNAAHPSERPFTGLEDHRDGHPESEAGAFEKDKQVFRQADGTEVIVSLKPRPGRHLIKYALAAGIAGGAQKAEFKDDSGLKVNDFLLLSFGTY